MSPPPEGLVNETNVALAVAIVSAGFSGLAWLANRRLARNDDARRHEEQTPQITLSCARPYPDAPNLVMAAALIGPDGLPRLRSITITITPNPQWTPARALEMGDILGPVELVGPYRFAAAAPGHGCSATRGPLRTGGQLDFDLEPSVRPLRISEQTWCAMTGTSVHLTLTCRPHGRARPWELSAAIPLTDGTGSATAH